jgi:flagellar basal body-associated protein FliL
MNMLTTILLLLTAPVWLPLALIVAIFTPNTSENEEVKGKKEYFEELSKIPAVKEDAELTNFIKNEIEILEKKEKTLTSTQKENEDIKDAILIYMEANKLYSVSDFMANVEECKELSNPKIASLLRQLMEEKAVEKIVSKDKKVYWKTAVYA